MTNYDEIIISSSSIESNVPKLVFKGPRSHQVLGGPLAITFFSPTHHPSDVVRIGRSSRLTGATNTLWYDFDVANYISQNVYHYGSFGADQTGVLDEGPDAAFYGLGAGVWVGAPSLEMTGANRGMAPSLRPKAQAPDGLVHVTPLDAAVIQDLIEFAQSHSR